MFICARNHVERIGTDKRINGHGNGKMKKRKIKLNISCWNVRTLNDSETGSSPARRTALVARELSRYGVDIAALSETRLPDDGRLEEQGGGFTFFWKGRKADERREAGVGFAIRSNLISKLAELPCGISDRLMTLRLHLHEGRYATVISAYAPTLVAEEDDKIAFYEELRNLLNSISGADKIILLGDFNARVGCDWETWSCLGRYGTGKMNGNGLHLLQLCTEFNLHIVSTQFCHKGDHVTTWMHPRSRQWHLIDYVIVRKRDMQDVCNVRSLKGADCWTDHALVRSKMRLVIKPPARNRRTVKLPKRLDVAKLRNLQTQEALQNCLSATVNSASWEIARDQIYSATKDTVGLLLGKSRDWFDENDQAIRETLGVKNKIRERLLQKDLPVAQQQQLNQQFHDAKSCAQRRLREMEDNWWSGIAAEMQAAADSGNSKEFYNLMKKVFGPKTAIVTPLRSKNGNDLLTSMAEISKRWKQHFSELLNRNSQVDSSALNNLEQRAIIEAMNDPPTLEEVHTSISKLNMGKAAGKDGIFAEVFRYGGDHMAQIMHSIIVNIWNEGKAPKDWKDGILIPLYKGKGVKELCGHFRGITLLSSAGKILVGIMLSRLNTHIVDTILPESQCGFRPNRGTMDMVFTARQLQEKAYEQCQGLFQVFVDLTKAFDTVNRDLLWEILRRLGCPSHFVDILQSFHDEMEVSVNAGGLLSEPFKVTTGVKQGDLVAPTLFSIFFSVVLMNAFENCPHGIHIRYRTSGRLFNIRRFAAKTKTFQTLVRDLLYADDCDLVSHSEQEMQILMDRLSHSCRAFGLTISLDKTVVMFQPAPGQPYVEPSIFVDGQRLQVVDKFVYLGSTINRHCSLEDEISSRLKKATEAFSALKDRVWNQRGLRQVTKISVYNACVLTRLLYSCETWVTYRRHLLVLERFHQRCLRSILGIHWSTHTPDTAVLERAESVSIETLIHRYRLRWAGHVIRLDDSRIPKQMLYGELTQGTRPQHKPRKRFKDCIKESLVGCSIDNNEWETTACDRGMWRQTVYNGCRSFYDNAVRWAQVKRAARKGEHVDPAIAQFKCHQCGRVCLSRAGLMSHMRSHAGHLQPNYDEYMQHVDLACQTCHKVCRNRSGLTRHMKVHERQQQRQQQQQQQVIPDAGPVQGNYVCCLCQKHCKSLAGFKSHCRSHNN